MTIKSLTQKVLIALLGLSITYCARSPIKSKDQALRLSQIFPHVSDDLGIASLEDDLNKYVIALERTSFVRDRFTYSGIEWTGKEVLQAYKDLALFLKTKPSEEDLDLYLKEKFFALEVYGNEDWSEVFITSYFEPMYKASKKRTKQFSHPIYPVPKNLVHVDLKGFVESHPQIQSHFDYIVNNQPGPRTLTGRLVDKRVLPFYSREEIIDKNALKDTKPIAWLDPVDNFFLQIQGSGTLLFGKKELAVGYAAQNGHEYKAIGKFLTEHIPLEEMTMTRIKDHLRTLPEDETTRLLNLNPSYVFFQTLKSRPLTSNGTEVIDGRTVATDSFYFPKGLIGFLDFQMPSDSQPTQVQRIVFNQDAGGAIKGPGRLDLFWGRGPEAGEIAGAIKQNGRLWFFLPKPNLP